MDIEKNIEIIRERIDAAARKSGRRGGDITIVAATKYADAGLIRGLSKYNINIFGENRVQDFLEKYGNAADAGDWQFIGQLQTNKVKYIIDKVKLIQSADRPQLLFEIDRQCALKNIAKMDILIEVNLSGETQKGGIAPDAVLDFYDESKKFPRIAVRGLMTVMPKMAGNGGNCRDLYLQMRRLYDILREKDNNIDILSMGMSQDYETAIECGATMVRPGRVLFS